MRGSFRKVLLGVLVAVVLAALIYRSRGAIHLQDFSWARLERSVSQARGSYLLLSLVTIYACYAVRALRWKHFARHLGPSSFRGTYNATLMGFSAIFLLGRAGEPVRPLLIARKEKLAPGGMFGIYVLERIFDSASTGVLAGLSLLVFPNLLSAGGGGTAWEAEARTSGLVLLVVLLAMVGFLVYFRLHGADALERRLVRWRTSAGWRRRMAGHFAGFSEGLQAIRTLPDLLVAVGYSALHWGLVALVYLLVSRSFGGLMGELDYPGAMLVLAVTMVGSTLQLPGVGGGAQVASFIAYTQIFGVEQEPAAAASIVLWLITFAASTLAGVPLMIREGWSMGELRRLARAEAEAEVAGAHLSEPVVPAGGGGESVRPGEPRR